MHRPRDTDETRGRSTSRARTPRRTASPTTRPPRPGHVRSSPTGAAGGFSTSIKRVGFRAVVAVSGEVDADTAEPFEAALRAATGPSDREVWIDLSEVTAMDLTAVRLLARARAACVEDGGELSVVCSAAPIRRFLTQTAAEHRLPVFASRVSAHRAS